MDILLTPIFADSVWTAGSGMICIVVMTLVALFGSH